MVSGDHRELSRKVGAPPAGCIPQSQHQRWQSPGEPRAPCRSPQVAASSFYAKEKLWVLRTSGLRPPSTSRAPQLRPACPIQWSQSWPPGTCRAHGQAALPTVPSPAPTRPANGRSCTHSLPSGPWGQTSLWSLAQALQTLPDEAAGATGLKGPSGLARVTGTGAPAQKGTGRHAQLSPSSKACYSFNRGCTF